MSSFSFHLNLGEKDGGKSVDGKKFHFLYFLFIFLNKKYKMSHASKDVG
jgi:hypothetical protein